MTSYFESQDDGGVFDGGDGWSRLGGESGDDGDGGVHKRT